MTGRVMSLLLMVLGSSVFLAHRCVAFAGQSQAATIAAETSAPHPSPAVQMLLDQASRQAEAQQLLNSLKSADQALEVSRQSGDSAGAAFALQARAKALQGLHRTDEALSAWQEAAQIWAGQDRAPQQIKALMEAGLLCVSGNKSEAEKLFAQALAAGKLETQNVSAVAQALQDSGFTLYKQEQDETAWEYFNAALAMREKAEPESLKLAESLIVFAQVALDRGMNDTESRYISVARDYAARAVEIEQRLAPDSSQVVESLHTLASSEQALENYGTARQHFLDALRLQKNIAPDGSMEQATILRELGNAEETQSNFPVAQAHLEEAVALAGKLAPESKEFERSLAGLAILEDEEGDLAAARMHFQSALQIKEKLHGNPASNYMNLGVVALDQYDLAAARDYFEKALDLFVKTHPNNAGVPFALGNLSQAYYSQGDFSSALQYAQRALAIDEAKMPLSLNTAEDLSLMGDILRDQGKFVAAAGYYHKALQIREKSAPESLRVADSLAKLAKLARMEQDLPLAVKYNRRALELGQKSCANSWCVVGILNDLGELAYEQGNLAGSQAYLRRAVEIREQSLGPMHPDLAHSLNSLALTVAALGSTSQALETALRAETIGRERLRMSIRSLSERQALALQGIRASGLDLAVTLAAARENTPALRGEIFDAVIRSRALVFDELAARHRAAYGSGDSEVTQLSSRLLSARARLATLVFRGIGDTKPDAYRILLDEAREGEEIAERKLAETSTAFRQDQARTRLGLREIAASLPQDAALVAFVKYTRHDFQAPRANGVAPKPVPAYAAFVLRAGEREPEFVQLGSARVIEGLVTAWRRDIAGQAESLDASAKTDENTYRRLGAALRRRIWDPLAPRLGDAKGVFIVPDAALHLVNLASLPVGGSRYLLETGPLIHYLSTERDLVPVGSRHGEGILVMGNPAFDQVGKLTVALNKQPALTETVTGAAGPLLRHSRSACGTFQTLRFGPLPASQREAENIAALWNRSTSGEGSGKERASAVQPGSGELLQVTGADASPEAFEQYAPGKRVLHVATHGFFLDGSCASPQQRRSNDIARQESSLPVTAENPLLLSGLAFAGANRRSSSKPGETDGILTAEEIAGINLEGVDWAVLSACDTGVGQIKAGEGVFGLRRAFQLAGAKTVIVSLWRVEDETTRQWMETLYRQHFLNGEDTAESVRAASLQILTQRRAKQQGAHPYYWGAFIAAGDWH